jgi:transglutaminase-like putative cysteine protease
MRLRISQSLHYRLSEPASHAIAILRLEPGSHDRQVVHRWRIDIDADCRIQKGEDAFGNACRTFAVEGPVSEIDIHIEGEVELEDGTGLVSGSIERFPASFYLRETPSTTASTATRGLAERIAAEHSEPLARLHAAMSKLAERDADISTRTHDFMALAHALGHPARAITGYAKAVGGPHAWAEVFVTGFGWVAFDPSLDLCPTNGHCRLAAGPDLVTIEPVRMAHAGWGTREASASTLLVPVDTKPAPFPTFQDQG